MLTQQSIFDKASQSLRDYGNPYGTHSGRGWGYVNPNNPSQRCAIASFIAGNTNAEVYENILKEVGAKSYEVLTEVVPVCGNIMRLFDLDPIACNNKELLEVELQSMANIYNLQYTAPKTAQNTTIFIQDKDQVLVTV